MQPRHAEELPQAAVDTVNARLAAASPDAAAASAEHITRVMTDQQEAAAAGRTPPPLLSALMPHLHAVNLVITGSHAKFWPRLKALLAPHVPVCTPMYAGTEGIYVSEHTMWVPWLPWSGAPMRVSCGARASPDIGCPVLPLLPPGLPLPATGRHGAAGAARPLRHHA